MISYLLSYRLLLKIFRFLGCPLDCIGTSVLDSEAVQRITELRLKGSDFQLIKVIGRGAYGEVQLVRHSTTRNVYAMKLLNKNEMVNISLV